MAGKIIAEPLPFDEAIDYFADKVPLTKDELKKLSLKAQKKAFTVATEQKMEAISGVKVAVEKALTDGISLGEFRKNVNALFDALGVTSMNPFHVETVFRTNIQTAYSVGRWQKMTHPDVLKERPYLEYDALDDARDSHAAMNGKIYPADHPIWDTWYPPNGFNCRCRVNSVSKEEISEEGLTVEKDIPQFVMPDDGFENNPAADVYEPDWSKYPAELRRQAGI